MPTCGVQAYSKEALHELVASYSCEPVQKFRKSVHAAYFDGYFAELKAKTIVVEDEYVDHDYLEDYAAYYARCFHSYPRVCRRLHFFDREFAPEDLRAILQGDLDLRQVFAESYIGFVIVRPIAGYSIGRTCLKTYEETGGNGTRHFPITRAYYANLQGIRLSLKSLAFQQQDRVVAACATAALWSAFHGTGVVFHHRIPSPIDITRNATAHFADETRTIPTSGLTNAQMADAVRACGLEPLMLRTTDTALLKGAARAYLMGHIPVLMIGGLYAKGSTFDPKDEIAVHAVAVTGFGIKADGDPGTGLQLESAKITKFYAHDDGVGPFARMEFLNDADESALLSTSLATESEKIGAQVFLPEGLLVPVYHKVRIAYPAILAKLHQFHDLLEYLRADGAILPNLTWDIQLITVNDYKSECIDKSLRGDQRQRLLEAQMPRYIWLARGRDGSNTVDLLFDATGLETVDFCFRCVDDGTNLVEWLVALRDAALDAAQSFECEEIVQQVLSAEVAP